MLSPEEVRRDTPHFDYRIFLDNASTHCPPRPVLQAMMDYAGKYGNRVMRGPPKPGAMVRYNDKSAKEAWENLGANTLENMAEFINAKDPTEIAMDFRNTTDCNHTVIFGLPWAKDDEVITFDINLGDSHAFVKLRDRFGIKIKVINGDEEGFIYPDEVEKNITKKTKLISLVAGQNRKGTIEPVNEVCKIARDHDVLTLIDAAQYTGRVPTDVQKMDCDFLCFPPRKGLMGPHGVGVLYGRRGALENLEPLVIGGKLVGGQTNPTSVAYEELPRRFDAGIGNTQGFVGTGAALKYMKKIGGIDVVRKHVSELNRYFIDELQKLDGIHIFGPKDKVEKNVGIWCFKTEVPSVWDLQKYVDNEYNMTLRANAYTEIVVDHVIRIGFGYYTLKEDIDKVTEAIRKHQK